MDNLSFAIFTSIIISGGYCNDFGTNYPASLLFSPRGVAGMNRNARPEWSGTGGRNQSESVAGMRRNTHSIKKKGLLTEKEFKKIYEKIVHG